MILSKEVPTRINNVIKQMECYLNSLGNPKYFSEKLVYLDAAEGGKLGVLNIMSSDLKNAFSQKTSHGSKWDYHLFSTSKVANDNVERSLVLNFLGSELKWFKKKCLESKEMMAEGQLSFIVEEVDNRLDTFLSRANDQVQWVKLQGSLHAN